MLYQALKLVLVGDAGIGKSTLIAKCHETHPTSAECGGFFAKTFDRSAEYKPTALKAYSTNVYSNPTGVVYSVYQANIVDTGGSTVLDYVRPLAYIHADLFILCFDVTNRASFENVASKWFPEIRLYEKKVPLMLVGLKPNPVEKRKVSKADAERMLTRVKENGSYFEVDSFNPKEDEASKLFEAAVEQAFQHRQTLSDRHLKNREKESSKDPSFDITNLSEPSPPPKTKVADSTLREDWKSTQERHESADVTIRFKNNDSVMTAHSFVLAVTSESFKELLCSLSSFGGEKAVEHLSPFREAKTKARDTIGSKVLYDITFEESIKPEAMNSVLAWMYTGHLDLKCKDLQSIGEAASTLKIKPLALLCEQSFKKKPPHPPPPPPLPPTGSRPSTRRIGISSALHPRVSPYRNLIPPMNRDPPPNIGIFIPPNFWPIIGRNLPPNRIPIPPPLPPIGWRSQNRIPTPPPLPPIGWRSQNKVPAQPPLPPIGWRSQNRVPTPPPHPPIGWRSQNRVPTPPPHPPIGWRSQNRVPTPPPLPPIGWRPQNRVPAPPPLPPIGWRSQNRVPTPPPLPPLGWRPQNRVPAPPPLPPIGWRPHRLPIQPPLLCIRGNPPRLPRLPSIVNRRPEAVVIHNYLREAFLQRSGFPPPTRMQAPKPSKKNTNTCTDLDPEAAHRSAWVKSTKDLFLNKALLSDITFVVKGVSVPAHRVVLITRSAVMAAMLDGKFRENDLAMIELPDVPLAPFLILLEYIYTDSCNLKDTNAREVLVLADRFCLDGLAARCEQFIIDSMPGLGVICDNEEFVESILDVFMFAKAFNSQYLTMWCLHVIATNYTIFEKTPEYNTILKENREYIEANRWLPRSYLKILNSYRARGTIVIPDRIQRHCPKHCGCTIL